MGKVDDSSTFSDNDWEEVKRKSDREIKAWIDDQMEKRSCLVVLIGATTYSRKWVQYEIRKAYELNKGIVGIYIHKLKDQYGQQTNKGPNPFDSLFVNYDEPLSHYVCCFDSKCVSSGGVYNDISENIENLIEYGLKNKVPK